MSHTTLNVSLPKSAQLPFSSALNLTLPMQGVTAIFGRSGIGKTSLLRVISGLDHIRGATVNVAGELWQSPQAFTPTNQRAIAYVFQNSGLLPHLTAKQNLCYALKRRNPNQSLADYADLLSLLNIHACLARKPLALSGGERQRVAIAVALVSAPKLLLMDEPLASLDQDMKHTILPYLEQLHQYLDIPVLYVSHSVYEVKRLADHVVWLETSGVAFSGSLEQSLQHPALATFLGHDAGVVISAKVVELDTQWQLGRLAFDGGSLWLRNDNFALGQALRCQINARDVSISLSNAGDSSILNRLQATIMSIEPEQDAAGALLTLSLGSTRILARLTQRSVHQLQLCPNMTVWIQVKSVAIL